MNNLAFIEETKFGNWFIRSDTWKTHVLCRALTDLKRFLPAPLPAAAEILDVGCGFGHSFQPLTDLFAPARITGLDADPDLQTRASRAAQACTAPVRLVAGHAAAMDFPDNQFDILFCHQSFHHLVEQEQAMSEFFRVLKPGGVLLFAESTKRYIHSLPIKLLFRHPMKTQKTADEYLAVIRASGFHLPDDRISMPYLWWSRPDIGFFEWIGFAVPTKREETLVNLVAQKPYNAE